MMEKIPFVAITADAMMCCPADNRVEKDTAILKRTVRTVTDSIAEQMTVTRRIAEDVFITALVNP